MITLNWCIKRNCLLILFILSLLLSACAMPNKPQETLPESEGNDKVILIEKELVIIADTATLRSGPGISFDNIGSLKFGTEVYANGQTQDGDWYRIRIPDGSPGDAWLFAEFVGPALLIQGIENETQRPSESLDSSNNPILSPDTATATTTATPTPTPLAEAIMISASVATNCRAGASRSFDVLGLLTPGNSVPVYGRSPDGQWWFIQNPDQPDKSCWIWADTTTVSGDLNQIPVINPPPTPNYTQTSYATTPTPFPTAFPAVTPTPFPTVLPALTPTPTPSPTASHDATSPPTTLPTIILPDTPTPTPTIMVTGQPPPPGTPLP
jgi:uncharacterized protein YgiM (DUF1202 family)